MCSIYTMKDAFMNTKFYYKNEKPPRGDEDVSWPEVVRLRMSLEAMTDGLLHWNTVMMHTWENDYFSVCMPKTQFVYFDMGEVKAKEDGALPAPVGYEDNFLHYNAKNQDYYCLDFADAKGEPMKGEQPGDFAAKTPLLHVQARKELPSICR